MLLTGIVRKQLWARGQTPGARNLVLNLLLDQGQDIFQFMHLFSCRDVNNFYLKYQNEIDSLCEEDELFKPFEEVEIPSYVKLALEKTLMLIEQELKVKCEV